MTSPPPPPATVLGIFAGGRATRMGGRDKAELLAPDTGEALFARALRLGREVGLECVLVGGRARGDAVTVVPDAPAGIGPLGGLRALLAYAGDRSALTLGCDMPYVTAALIARLACDENPTPILAPRDNASGKWQSLFARYDAARVLPELDRAIAGGARSFQAFFHTQAIAALALSAAEHALLRDWDEPADLEPT